MIHGLIVCNRYDPLILVEDIIWSQLDFQDIGVLAAVANDVHLVGLAQLQLTQTLAQPFGRRVEFDNGDVLIQFNDVGCLIMEQVLGQGNTGLALWRNDPVSPDFEEDFSGCLALGLGHNLWNT